MPTNHITFKDSKEDTTQKNFRPIGRALSA